LRDRRVVAPFEPDVARGVENSSSHDVVLSVVVAVTSLPRSAPADDRLRTGGGRLDEPAARRTGRGA
jgi:hypothetical protein